MIIKNNKGQITNIIYLVGILFILMFIGLLLAFGGSIINWVMDESVPELTSLGTVGDSNLTEYSSYTITPVNTIIQNFTWLFGIFYILALVSCFGLAFAFRITGNKWLISLFVIMIFMLIITSIFISNIYEDFYNDSGEIGTRLHEQTLLSWLLLYSPLVMSVIGFVCGIIMFTGEREEYLV